MNLLSEHNRILRVGEGGTEVYLPGDNINITDHVISGKYWDNEIKSAISSTSGNIVNEAFNQSTAWNEGQGYLTAHQDVSNLPYVQNSALDYNGNLVSSISGKGLFAESANNSYHAESATHAGSVESANFASSALNSESANFANSAWRAVYVDGGWEHDSSGNITAYNNSAFVGSNGRKYEGVLPIVVNNEEMKISAKSAAFGVQAPLYLVEDSETATVIGIDSGAFPTFEGTTDGKISAINGSAINAAQTVDYSAGDNIDISNNIISVTGLDTLSSNIVNQTKTEITSVDYASTANIAKSANSATYDSLGRKIVDTYLTAHQDWTNTIQNASGNAYNSAVNWVVDQNYLTAVTGDNTPYSAGANIDITEHVVSGKDWTSEIQAASSYAYDQATTQIPAQKDVKAGANVYVSTASTAYTISSKDWNTEIAAASSYAYEQSTGTIPDVTNLDYVQNTALNIANGSITSISSYNVGHPQVPVSGESGVYLTKRDGTVYIGYSGTGGGGQGVDYTGIAPIVVNNEEHKISAQSAMLGVQSPLYFVEDSESATVIGISGLPEVEGVMYESALGLSEGFITGYNNSAFGGGGSEGVQSDWTETATANLAYIKNKPSEYNLVAGHNVTITLVGNDLIIDSVSAAFKYTTGSI